MKSIVIIEDDKSLSKLLKDVLIEENYIVDTANTGLKGLELIEKKHPDLVLLDLGLPKVNGEYICKNIKDKYPSIIVIVLTAKNTSEDMIKGYNFGANDYVTKPFDIEVLLAIINSKFRDLKTEQKLLTANNLLLDIDKHEVRRNGEVIELTLKEFNLLQYLLINKGRVLTRNMILNRVWSSFDPVETRIVDIFIGFLRKKIDSNKNSPPLIHSIRGVGYMIKDEVA